VTQYHGAQHQLIQQVRRLDGVSRTDQVGDVLISGDAIAAIAPQITDLPPATEVIDGRDKVLLPGLVDLYSQSGEPGYEQRETLLSLMRSATAGGVTRLGILPTTSPALDQPALLAALHRRRQEQPSPAVLPHLYPWAALTVGTQGQQMTELGELALAPSVGFSDGQPLPHPLLLQRLLQYLQPLGKPVAFWPCDSSLRADGVAREGPHALIYGLSMDPPSSETAPLAALLEMVALVGTPIHLMRLSTARGVALIAEAKAQGLPITASTSWLHLLLSSQDLHSYDANLHLAPPLGTPEDRAALVAAVKTGVIDAIAIDHTPYTYEEKTVGFAAAPPGAIGLELAWPLLWQHLVAEGDWAALDLVQALSTRPAHCWGQSPPRLQVGEPAELALFDPACLWTVNASSLQSLAANTSWWGETLRGKILKTWVPIAPA
jgi:dihydroorotase